MNVSILPEHQSGTREKILAEVRELGMGIGPEKEQDIKLAIGEAIINCSRGGLCVENEVEVDVYGQGDDIVVAINASCYENPVNTRSWFGHPCKDVDPNAEYGRGDGIIEFLTKEIVFLPGSLSLVF